MLQRLFHAWERRLASVTKDRVVRPFDWGLDWIPHNGQVRGAAPPGGLLGSVLASGLTAAFNSVGAQLVTVAAAPLKVIVLFP